MLRWLAAAAVAISTFVAAPLGAHAAPYGEPLIDCTSEGDEYLFYFSPSGAVTAWVTDESGATVSQADAIQSVGYWEVRVPAGTDYATVWISDGTQQVSTPAESPDCGAVTVSLETQDYGPGLVPISPQRLYDTRSSKDRLAPGTTIEVQAAGEAGVPTNATAVMVNVAAVNPVAAGHLTVYPCGGNRPTTAGLTYAAGETRAGASLVQLGPTGKLCVYSPTSSDVVVDAQGYVADSDNPVAIRPVRVLDTRIDDTPIDGNRLVDLGDMSALNLPFDPGNSADEVAGLWLNVSAVRATAPGHLTVHDAYDSGDSTTSRLNYVVGRAQTNLVFSPVQNGEIRIETSSKTHVTVDVVAVTRHPNALVPIPDFRLLDTRRGPNNTTTDGRLQGTGRLQPNVERHILIGGRLGPIYPTAVLLNVAVVNPTAATHVTVYPCGTRPPTVSSGNATEGSIVSNAVFTPIGTNSSICIVSPVETDVVVDLEATTTTRPIGAYISACLTSTPLTGDFIFGGKPPYSVTGVLPEGTSLRYRGGRFWLDQPADTKYVVGTSLLVTDSVGKTIDLNVNLHWALAIPPRPIC